MQAAGWVALLRVPAARVDPGRGRRGEVLVQESDRVEAGQPVALLVDEDARLAVARVLAPRAPGRSDPGHAGGQGIAKERFEAGLEVTEAARIASSELQQDQAIAAKQRAAVVEGRARLELAQEDTSCSGTSRRARVWAAPGRELVEAAPCWRPRGACALSGRGAAGGA